MSKDKRVTKQQRIDKKAKERLLRAYCSISDALALLESRGINLSDLKTYCSNAIEHLEKSDDMIVLTELTAKFAQGQIHKQKDESTI